MKKDLSCASETEPIRLLLLEDDQAIAEEICRGLEHLGYDVETVANQEDGFAAINERPPSLVLADRILENVDSVAMVEKLRAGGNEIPILFISNLASVDDRVCGLNAGGDDYIAKPFAIRELAARIAALLRRSTSSSATILKTGALTIDYVSQKGWRDGRELGLLPREFKLLEYFMQHPNQLLTRNMFLEKIWNYKVPIQTNVVDVHIGNIRRKVDAAGEPRLIECVRGVGYILHVGE
jgi:two-component system OmpR family response regulator